MCGVVGISSNENVAADILRALDRSLLDHCSELVDPRVHTTRGQQPDKVQRVASEGGLHVLPASVLVDLPVGDVDVDKLGALGVDLARTQSVVANLGVAHVVRRGQAHSRAVRLRTRGVR